MTAKELETNKDDNFRPSGVRRGALENDMEIKKSESTAGDAVPVNFDTWSAMGGRDGETGAHNNVSGFGSRRADVTFGENDVQRVLSLEEEAACKDAAAKEIQKVKIPPL